MLHYSMKWLNHFERHAIAARDSCKDPTGVGAVLIGEDNEVLLTAFNGPSIGVRDTPERRFTRPLKYDFASHAERNLINFAARNGIRTKGLTVYATHHPCPDCANAIVQSGIKCIIIGSGQYKSGTPDKLANADSILREGKVQILKHSTSMDMQRADAFCRAGSLHVEDQQGIPYYYAARRVADRLMVMGFPDYYSMVPLLLAGVVHGYMPNDITTYLRTLGFSHTSSQTVTDLVLTDTDISPLEYASKLPGINIAATLIAFLVGEDDNRDVRWFGVDPVVREIMQKPYYGVQTIYREAIHTLPMHEFMNGFGASPYNMNSSAMRDLE